MAGSGFQQLGNRQERSCLWAPGKTHQSHQQSELRPWFLHAGTRRFLRWLISTHLAHLGTDVAANWWVSPCDWFFFETIQLDYHALSRQCLEKTKVPTCSNTRITISQIKCWRYYSLQSFYHQVTPFLVSVVSEHWQCWKSVRGLTDNIW